MPSKALQGLPDLSAGQARFTMPCMALSRPDLKRSSPVSLKQQIADQAALTPGCNNPVVFVTSFAGRKLGGQIQFTDSNGQPQTANF